MKNSEKSELRADVRELSRKDYSKKEGVKTLVEWGYCYSTARSYWDVFAVPELPVTICPLDKSSEVKNG